MKPWRRRVYISIEEEMYGRETPTSKHISNCWGRTRPRLDEVKTRIPLDTFYILSCI